MKQFRYFLYILALTFIIPGCGPSDPIISDEAGYIKSIEQWQHQRVERLKGKNGWLNLAGLFWLEEGENSFGSDSSNQVVFPEKADPFCGTLTLNGGAVHMQVKEGILILLGGSPVREADLIHDHADNTTHLLQGDLAWYIIKRGERYGIRMRDYKHPRIEKLDHIPSYPIQTGYVVEASLKPFDMPRTMVVPTPVEGFTESYECPGELHFKINNKKLVLYPFAAGEGYFFVFADETTGMDTYGAGRFMYSMPDSSGRIVLDFNKAYNPPCAFSPYATCPMPPRENFLPIAIEAGEKSVHLE